MMSHARRRASGIVHRLSPKTVPAKAGYRRALWEVRNVSIWVF